MCGWVCGVWDGYGQRLGLYGVWRGWYGGGGVMLSNLLCVGLGMVYVVCHAIGIM